MDYHLLAPCPHPLSSLSPVITSPLSSLLRSDTSPCLLLWVPETFLSPHLLASSHLPEGEQTISTNLLSRHCLHSHCSFKLLGSRSPPCSGQWNISLSAACTLFSSAPSQQPYILAVVCNVFSASSISFCSLKTLDNSHSFSPFISLFSLQPLCLPGSNGARTGLLPPYYRPFSLETSPAIPPLPFRLSSSWSMSPSLFSTLFLQSNPGPFPSFFLNPSTHP